MEFGATLLGWAGIIVFLAAPLIVGALVLAVAGGGIAALKSGHPLLGFLGVKAYGETARLFAECERKALAGLPGMIKRD